MEDALRSLSLAPTAVCEGCLFATEPLPAGRCLGALRGARVCLEEGEEVQEGVLLVDADAGWALDCRAEPQQPLAHLRPGDVPNCALVAAAGPDGVPAVTVWTTRAVAAGDELLY